MDLPENEYRSLRSSLLDKHIFFDLTNLNNGFDSAGIKYFSASDFRIVLDRIEVFRFGLLGIETWLNGEMYDVLGPDDYQLDAKDPSWYNPAFQKFVKTKLPLVYSATYDIPKNALNDFNKNESTF